MGQKAHPIGFRVGITEPWKSRWYAPKASYGQCLVEDERIRRFVEKKFNQGATNAGVSKVEIERTRDEVRVALHTARAGVVIGAKGSEVDKLKEQLEELIDRRVAVSIHEVKEPDLDARLIGMAIADQLRKRASFRRVMKMRCEAAMAAGAKGVKIICSGRLGNAELARTESQMLGAIPLQTLQAEVDYACSVAITTVGTIGIKVWIYRGRYGDQPVQVDNQQRGDGRFRRRGRR